MRRVAERGLVNVNATRGDATALPYDDDKLRRGRAHRGARRDPRPGRGPERDRAGAEARRAARSSASCSATRTTPRPAPCAVAARRPACAETPRRTAVRLLRPARRLSCSAIPAPRPGYRLSPCRDCAASTAPPPGSGGSAAGAASATRRPTGRRSPTARCSSGSASWRSRRRGSEVWICPHPNGHIQATGYDEAGRKQYLYHPHGARDRDREKFAEMERFARSLPRMRERTEEDLGRRGLVRERVLACAVRLLDLGFFRIGSERYAEENETFGLATLRRRHVTIARGVASFDYKAKGAKRPPPGDRRPGDRADARSSSRSARAAATSCSPTATGARLGATSRRRRSTST